MRRFEDQVVVITGGAAGIGRAIVEQFAEEKASVIAMDIDAPGLQELERYAAAHGWRVKGVRLDVSDETVSRIAIEEILAQYDKVDILINNAARFVLKGIKASAQDWRNSFGVNVFGAATCTKHISEAMIKQRKGAIVNIASISGIVAQPQFLTYSTTKAAIIQMTKNLALDLGGHGIRVNCVSPGTIITKASEKHVAKLGITLEEFKRLEGKKTALHKVGRPDDVANAVLFLASDDAAFITGTNLMVDGGYTIV